MAYCVQCGTKVASGNQLCPRCVAVAAPAARQPVAKNRTAARAKPPPVPASSALPADPSHVPPVSAFVKLPRADAIRLIVKAGTKALAKSLALGAAVLAPGFLLMVMGQVLLGAVWLFVGSFALMAWTYRKPWRLGWVSCLTPAIAAALCYLVQYLLFGDNAPSQLWVAVALAAGVALGWVRGQAHHVYEEKDSLFAQRTHLYLLIWAAAYGITQLFSLGANALAVYGGLLTSAFTTAMLATVSVVLFVRMRALRAAAVALVLLVGGGAREAAFAQGSDTLEAWKLLMDAGSRVQFNQPTLNEPPAPRPLQNRTFGTGRPLKGASSLRDRAEARYDWYHRAGEQKIFNTSAQILLTRHTSAAAAQPTLGDAGAGAQVIQHNGVPVLARAGQTSAVAVTSREHFKIRVGAITNLGSRRLTDDEARDLQQHLLSTAIALAAVFQQELRIDASTPRGSGGGRGIREWLPSFDWPQGIDGPSDEAIIAATAIIATILIGAGVAVNVAQTMAGSIANAIAAGVELTAEDMSDAILEGLRRSGTPPSDQVAPPPRPPPIVDPKTGEPFETNDDGRYWAPGENGDWQWMNREDALQARDALQDEVDGRARQQTAFARETQEVKDEMARRRAEEVAELDRQRQRRAAAEAEAARRRAAARQPVVLPPELEGTFASDFLGGSARDLGTLIVETPGAIAGVIGSALGSAFDALTDRANWEAVGDTLLDIGGSMTGNPQRTQKVASNLATAGLAALDVAGKLTLATLRHPVDTAVAVTKAVLGAENWEKAVDPKVPVTERFARAAWGTIDTGSTLIGLGAAALKRLDRLADIVRGVDRATDAAKAVDKVADGVRAVDQAGEAVKLVDGAGDAASAGRGGAVIDDLAHVRKPASPPDPLTALRDKLRNQQRGPVAPERLRVGPHTERPGIPNMATRPVEYIRGLPSGTLIDRNLAVGSGYTGHQIDDMVRMARGGGQAEERIIIGARTTNLDSMRHIRDGTAVPKPQSIKANTISELDTYLGARRDDKGLVGYFRPNKPYRNSVPANLWDDVSKRYDDRLKDFYAQRSDVNKLIAEGRVVERDGKLHAVIRRPNGATELKPYAGDIDGVYFKDANTGEKIGPGERYNRLRDRWMGLTDGSDAKNYWERSRAPGQHGVETNMVADMTRGLTPGTPEYEKALEKAQQLHAKLADKHYRGSEVIVEVHPDGHLRRGIRLHPENAPLPDLTRQS